MCVYVRVFFFPLQLLKIKKAGDIFWSRLPPGCLPPPPRLRCMFPTHRNTVNHRYVSRLSPRDNFQLNNTFFSPTTERLSGRFIFLSKHDSLAVHQGRARAACPKTCARFAAGGVKETLSEGTGSRPERGND